MCMILLAAPLRICPMHMAFLLVCKFTVPATPFCPGRIRAVPLLNVWSLSHFTLFMLSFIAPLQWNGRRSPPLQRVAGGGRDVAHTGNSTLLMCCSARCHKSHQTFAIIYASKLSTETLRALIRGLSRFHNPIKLGVVTSVSTFCACRCFKVIEVLCIFGGLSCHLCNATRWYANLGVTRFLFLGSRIFPITTCMQAFLKHWPTQGVNKDATSVKASNIPFIRTVPTCDVPESSSTKGIFRSTRFTGSAALDTGRCSIVGRTRQCSVVIADLLVERIRAQTAWWVF